MGPMRAAQLDAFRSTRGPDGADAAADNDVLMRLVADAGDGAEVDAILEAWESPAGRRRLLGKRGRAPRGEDREETLMLLLAACVDEEEREEVLDAWKTPEGRERLIAFSATLGDEEESRSPSPSPSPSPVRIVRRKHRAGGRRLVKKAELADLCGSDDEKMAVVASIQDERDATQGITTRHGAVVARQPRKGSVPISTGASLRERLKRRAGVSDVLGTGASRAGNARQSQRRAAPAAESSDDNGDDEESDDDSDQDDDDVILISDADEEEDVQRVLDEGDEEEDEEEEEDADYVVDSEGEIDRRQNRRKKQRRKLTTPTDHFETPERALTAEEQRERLEALVKQSADISRDLNSLMAQAAGAGDVGTGKPAESTVSDAAEVIKEDQVEPATATPRLQENAETKLVPPCGKDTALQPHQLDGVNWLLTLDAQGLNAILADEMGLGKTIQAVSFLASLVLAGERGPHLVIAPKNVCEHWAEEVNKWYPGQIKVVTHLGRADERYPALKKTLKDDDFDIMITSFDLALRDLLTKPNSNEWNGARSMFRSTLRAFKKLDWEYVVIDEAHRLKNDEAKLSVGLRNFQKARRRLLLTGTPLSNNLRELWSLMNVLNPRIFSSKATFETWFAAPFDTGAKGTQGFLTIAEQSVIVDRLHTVLRPFFRRRLRADVCPAFSSADEVVIRCPMSALQRALCYHFHRRRTEQGAGMTNVLMALRGASNHPYISSEALFDESDEQVQESLVASSGKFYFLYHALPRLIAAGHRVLIFSQFRRTLDFLEDLMDVLGIRFGRLDGLTDSESRMYGVADFNREGSDIPVFLLSTRAGGVGINLQTADTVFLFDSDWNPSQDLQAVSRIQRIGQKKTVHIMRLVTDGSIDEVIVDRARHKLRTEAVAVEAGKFSTSASAAGDQKMRQKDLEEILQAFEAQQSLVTSEGDPPSESSPVSDDIGGRATRASSLSAYMETWDCQLRRAGEGPLPESSHRPISLAVAEDGEVVKIPLWLRKEADLAAAAAAIRCQDSFKASEAFEAAIRDKALRSGERPAKRASKARTNVLLDDISDVDSDDSEKGAANRRRSSGRESDPSVEMDDEDVSFSDDDNAEGESQDEFTTPEKRKAARCTSKVGIRGKQARSASAAIASEPNNLEEVLDLTNCTPSELPKAGNCEQPMSLSAVNQVHARERPSDPDAAENCKREDQPAPDADFIAPEVSGIPNMHRLIERLRKLTSCDDVDVLVDAILESNGDIDEAAVIVFSNIVL